MLLQTTVVLDSRYPAGTPNGPVNYSEVCHEKLEGEEFASVRPWAPDTVRWHTG
jgi:hypothetical protein